MKPLHMSCLFGLTLANLVAQELPTKLAENDIHHDPARWVKSEDSDAHGLLYERWNNVPGKSVTYGRMMNGRKAKPVVKGHVADLSTLPNDGKHYMTRLRGWVVAPKTGTYLLMLSADDNAELWLSSSESQFDKKRLAWITGDGWFGYSNPEESRRINSQRATAFLKAGQKYYLEVWHKESTGADHLTVKWWFEKDKHSKILSQENLIPWKTDDKDLDDNGLPDDWQQKYELSADSDAWDDSDSDGVNNFDEYKAGTNPKDPQGVDGSLLWETWFGFGGNQVIDFTTYSRTRFAADRAVFLKGSSIPVEYGSNCSYRLTGYVTPKESGAYQFAITGDDATELWLSNSDDPAMMKRIAFSDRRRGNFNWTAVPSQQSAVLQLEAKRSYFIQVLCKNGRNEGRAELGWKRAGDEKFVSIAPEFLKSPNLRENDRDRNRLDDQWVAKAVRSDLAKQAKLDWISEWGDPDRDGINNRLEFLNGSDPMVAKSIAGKLTRQWWFNVPGQSLAEERVLRAKLNKPSMVTLPDQAARLERNTTDSFLSRTRGYITAPVTGTYRFWIAADDTAELWLSHDSSKFHKQLIASVGRGNGTNFLTNGFTGVDSWDQYSQQQSKDITLQAGEMYFIEILHKENGGDDHASVAWSYREKDTKTLIPREVIPAAALSSFAIDTTDQDDDYLPDAWEKEYKLNTADNGARDFAKQGERGDFDADGLTNYQEYLLGTNPTAVDTDGDGINDGVEVNLYGSNPKLKDASPPKVYANLPLKQFSSPVGQWAETRKGTLVSTSRRGPVSFTIEINDPGIYVLELNAGAVAATSYVAPIPVLAFVDDKEVGRTTVTAKPASSSWLTQWLSAGSHVVTIDNHNLRAGNSLEIHSLTLHSHVGDDDNGNHIPDWMEKLFARSSQITSTTLDSLTSPLCLEGFSRIADDVRVDVAGSQEARVMHSIGNQWYANAVLSAVGETVIKASFERGAITQELSVRWAETNILASPDSMTIRAGDALKLSAYVAGDQNTYTIFCNGTKLPAEENTNYSIFHFERPGVYQLIASAAGDVNAADAALRVEVLSADFGKTFSLASGSSRNWKLPAVPHNLLIEADPILELKEKNTTPEQARQFEVTSFATLGASPRVIARLYEGGPIVASTAVESFYLASSSITGNSSVIRTLPDGTRVVRVTYAIDGKIPDDLSIWIQLYVTDAVFANGDTWYELTAADFNENGEASLEIYKAPGFGTPWVCHWINPFMESLDDESKSNIEQ